jgi:class 3 adenylate cyclase/tetratricopeptide (TPR) repeat protein
MGLSYRVRGLNAMNGMRCPGCGTGIGQGDRFCRLCGLPLASGDTIQEHRYITALYSDLNEYTILTALLDPEDLKVLMDTIFNEASRIITSFGGTVEKFLGDAIVALFGIIRIHEDDVIRAIHSASAIHGFVGNLGGKIRRTPGERLSMHTGVHTGIVLVDSRSTSLLSHGAMGMPINIAARLSALAEPGEILIDKTARHEAERFFLVDYIGEKKLKGIMKPVSVYRVSSQRGIPLSVHRPSSLNTEMVGRDEPLSVLMKALENLLIGKGAFVLITGEAGVGKSRLVHEFGRLFPSDVSSFTVQCLDHMKDTPYYPIVSMIKQLITATGERRNNNDRAIEERLLNPRHAFRIRSLLGPRQEKEDFMPDVWKTEIIEAVSALVHECSKIRPVVICMEDFHWADATTRDLVDSLAYTGDGNIPCLLIITSREGHKIHPSQIVIGLHELSRENTKVLLQHILGNKDISDETADPLYRVTGGNPLYIEEYVSYLNDKGIMLNQKPMGKWSGSIPSTVHGLISARLEILGEKCRHLLQEASIIGMVFSKSLLQAITSSDADLESSLKELEQAGFISRLPSGDYCFRHALTREVASMTLLRRQRTDLHRKIGFQLERSSTSRSENCGIIAYHLYHAREYMRAYPYCVLSARTYQSEGSWIEAAAHYKMAQESLLMIDDLPDRDELLIAVHEGIWSCSKIFNPNQAIDALEELTRLYREAGYKSQEVFSQIRLINLYSQRAQFKKALCIFDEILPEIQGNDLLVAAAKTAVAYTYTFLGKPDVSLRYLQEARCGLGSSDSFLLSVNYLTTLAAFVWKGRIDDALTWYSLTKEQSPPYLDIDLMAEILFGYVLFLKGEIREGQKILEEIRMKEKKLGCLAGGFSYLRIQSSVYLYTRYIGWMDRAREELYLMEAQESDSVAPTELICLYRAWVALEQEQYQEVKELLESALPSFESGVANRVPYALNALAEALIMLGELEYAERIVRRCIDWNLENGNMDQLIWAWRLKGSIHLKQGNKDSARHACSAAYRLSYAWKMKPHIAWSIVSLGDYYAVSGKWRKAQACYAKGSSLWKAMGCPYQSAKIDRKYAGVPN